MLNRLLLYCLKPAGVLPDVGGVVGVGVTPGVLDVWLVLLLLLLLLEALLGDFLPERAMAATAPPMMTTTTTMAMIAKRPPFPFLGARPAGPPGNPACGG